MRMYKYVLLLLLSTSVTVVTLYFKSLRILDKESGKSVKNTDPPIWVETEYLDNFIASPLQNSSNWSSYPEPKRFGSNSLEYDRLGSSSGKEEQFTITVLTYDRTESLLRLLNHLSGLPQLAQVIIIWNHPVGPSPDLQWPQLNYTYRVLRSRKNSLNNRFVPLTIIETDGVFVLDDDMCLDHSSIILAFRVWQAHRDRLVGFKGRGALWDHEGSKWKYDPRPTIVSMVLTGSAFIHKRYMYAYTYDLPSAIRKHVDQNMNCEDVATAFMVSFISQTPPIEIGYSDKSWLCIESTGLWQDTDHFSERNACLNYFTEVFGFMPLLRSEYRMSDFMVLDAR